MKKYFICLIILISFLIYNNSLAQQTEEPIRVIGDSLVGKVVNGESVREVVGNVVLTQGKVVVTCDKAIQFLANNEAELVGNVIVTQDSMELKTKRGFYYGNLRKTKSVDGLILDDKKVILSADSGEYFFDRKLAIFETNVELVDSVSTLTSDKLYYYQDIDKATALGNVEIKNNETIINADSLDHFRRDKTSFAFRNVKISNIDNNTVILGDYLEDYDQKKYTIIDKNPLLIQIDSSKQVDDEANIKFQIDTLVIKSLRMEAYRDTLNLFKAIDSVRIVRGKFASVNDLSLYYRTDEKIITEKINDEAERPVLWYDQSQLSGDSIAIYLHDQRISSLEVFNNAFMLSSHEKFEQRYDQTSSTSIEMIFENNDIRKSLFNGNVRSIYYLFDLDEPSGLTKSSSNSAAIIFKDNEVSEVRLYGSPSTEYYPENKVVNMERTFTLPKFVLYQNRPKKSELIKN